MPPEIAYINHLRFASLLQARPGLLFVEHVTSANMEARNVSITCPAAAGTTIAISPCSIVTAKYESPGDAASVFSELRDLQATGRAGITHVLLPAESSLRRPTALPPVTMSPEHNGNPPMDAYSEAQAAPIILYTGAVFKPGASAGMAT